MQGIVRSHPASQAGTATAPPRRVRIAMGDRTARQACATLQTAAAYIVAMRQRRRFPGLAARERQPTGPSRGRQAFGRQAVSTTLGLWCGGCSKDGNMRLKCSIEDMNGQLTLQGHAAMHFGICPFV